MHDYDKTKESTCSQYLDFNNQYEWVLSHPLPCGRFDHVENIPTFTHDFIINYDKFGDFGYILIVHDD